MGYDYYGRWISPYPGASADVERHYEANIVNQQRFDAGVAADPGLLYGVPGTAPQTDFYGNVVGASDLDGPSASSSKTVLIAAAAAAAFLFLRRKR